MQLWAILYVLMILVSVLSLTLDTHEFFRIVAKEDQVRLSDSHLNSSRTAVQSCYVVREDDVKVHVCYSTVYSRLIILGLAYQSRNSMHN